MSNRLFTLEEANRILPLVRAIARDAVDRYRTVKREIHALERMKAELRAGGAATVDDVRAQDARIEALLDGLRRLVEELEALGCRLRDYERGVVDFPGAGYDGEQFLCYCWALGEDRVTHWHGEAEGFEERRAVGAGASA